MGLGHSPSVVTSNLLLSLDFANIKDYVSGTTLTSSVTPYSFTFKNGLTYNTISNGILTINRAATVTTKTNDGGGVHATGTGNLAVANFLYNDFTWEVWVKINDRTPSNYDGNESNSTIAGYPGYNAGFYYNSSNLYFNIWNGTTNAPIVASWTLGTSTQDIVQGNWYQIVLTRSGNVFTPYVNGAQKGTGSTSATTVAGIGTQNVINVGFNNLANFIWYAKMDFSNMRMYNRALSALEVLQNFNALRGRFGI